MSSEMNNLRPRHALCTLVLLGLSLGASAAEPDRFALAVLPNETERDALTLWATHYNVHAVVETEFGLPLRDKAGAALTGNLSPKDWCLGAIEGTIYVRADHNSRTYNFVDAKGASQVDCASVLKIDPRRRKWIRSVGRSTFAPARGTYGDGVRNLRLVPYRTIAVDSDVLPIGSVIYVPIARGSSIVLPTGEELSHDGYFFAGDTGGAIKGTHVDVFCGELPSNCLPSFIGSSVSKTFRAYIVTDPATISALRSSHEGR